MTTNLRKSSDTPLVLAQDSQLSNSSGRLIRYDFARAVAMSWVIAVHSLVVINTSTIGCARYLTLAQAVFFSANSIFFMISGHFNLTERNSTDIARFYLKKIRGIVLPVLILFFLRTLYDLYPDFGSIGHVLKTYAKNTLGQYSSMEYWFIFQLISFLVVVPFLAPATEFLRHGHQRQRLFVGLGLVWFVLLFVTNNTGVIFSWSFLFTGFWFPFLIGPFVESLFAEHRSSVLLLVATALCPLATLWLVVRGYSIGAFDNSPFYMLSSMGFYLVLLFIGNRIPMGGKLSKAISFIARHSFTVYLVHMMVLLPLSRVLPVLEGGASIGMHWVLALFTFAISLIIAWLVDCVLIKPVQALFDILVEKIAQRSS